MSLEGLLLSATDSSWSSGSGDRVTGTCEALALSLTGRAALLDELGGPGAPTLRERVLTPRP